MKKNIKKISAAQETTVWATVSLNSGDVVDFFATRQMARDKRSKSQRVQKFMVVPD